MNTNCTLCQSILIFDVYDDGVEVSFCPKCDRNCKKKSLGGLLGAIKGNIHPQAQRIDIDSIWEGAQQKLDEITIQYHCIKCGCPTNQYGWCLWCEDGLRETL